DGIRDDLVTGVQTCALPICERYSINLRYVRDARSDLDGLKRVLVAASDGAQIPITQLADIAITTAPPSIRDEDGQLVGYVFVDEIGRASCRERGWRSGGAER